MLELRYNLLIPASICRLDLPSITQLLFYFAKSFIFWSKQINQKYIYFRWWEAIFLRLQQNLFKCNDLVNIAHFSHCIIATKMQLVLSKMHGPFFVFVW